MFKKGTPLLVSKFVASRIHLNMSKSIILPELKKSFLALAYAKPDGTFLDVNNSFCKTFEYTKKEMLSKNILDISLNESHENTLQLINELEKGIKNSVTAEKKYLSKSGRVIYAKLQVSFVKKKNYLFAEIMDITNEKNAYSKIEENEIVLNTINKNVSEGIFRIYKDQFIYLNQGFSNLFEYESEEAFEIQPSLLFPSGLIERLHKTKRIQGEEVVLQKADGTKFYGLVSIQQCPEFMCKQYYDGSIADITRIKRQKQTLRKTNKKLKLLNEELDLFVYKSSHDLKAPIKSLKGLINLSILDSDNRGVYIGKLRQSVERIDNFTDDVLNHYKNSRAEKKYELVDLKGVVEKSIDMMRYSIGFENIEINTYSTNELGFYSDLMRIEILIFNLISNAIKFHNPKQRKPYIDIRLTTTEKYTNIQITDNGIGIDESYHLNVFKMFFRASQIAQGSGLGLYTVKVIVKKLNGQIEMESKIDEGTSFTITLPNEVQKILKKSAIS